MLFRQRKAQLCPQSHLPEPQGKVLNDAGRYMFTYSMTVARKKLNRQKSPSLINVKAFVKQPILNIPINP